MARGVALLYTVVRQVNAPATPDVETEYAVVTERLGRRFGELDAVVDLSLRVERGTIFGFLGPNGAGKTSTMRMIGCVSPRSGGDLRVLGMDPARDGRRIRARLGVVPQEDNLDTELTVWDNLMIYGRYFDLPRAEIRKRTDNHFDCFPPPQANGKKHT